MEDNELKSIWRKADQHTTTSEELDRVYDMTQKKSVSVIDRFKRVIILETLFGTLIFAWFGILLIQENDWYWFGLLIGLAGFQYYFFTYDILARLKQIDYSQPLSIYLRRARNIIGKYVQFYTLVTYIALPLGFIMGAIRSFQDQDPIMQETRGMIIFFILFTLFTIGFSALVIWYIKKVYGSKVKKLDQLLSEIDVEEEED